MTSHSEDLQSAALAYHRLPRPGKLEIQATKPLGNQRDLALAYSPGVAAACEAIAADPAEAAIADDPRRISSPWSPTAPPCSASAISARSPSKPVMEGKAVLFKKFAGIDVFDIEVAENDRRRAGRHRGRAGADLRRHQSRGHQGARSASRSRSSCKARMKHPGVPRRPARHRDHRRRRRHQRAGARRQEDRRRQDRRVRRRRGGARLPQPAGLARRAGARTSGSPTSRASSTRAATKLMDRWKAVYAQKTDKRARSPR